MRLFSIALGLAALVCAAQATVGGEGDKQIAHMVYFKLKDNSPKAVTTLVESCNKNLSGHDGVVYYSAGVLSDLKRDVNDRDWDVALHLVFKDMASHEKYQTHPRHEQFIKEGKANWAKVRVFDAAVAPK